MKTINEIIRNYTTGEADLEKTNTALAKAKAGFRFEPGKNEITEEDRKATTVGYYPEQANGWGLLSTGTGSMEKVHVVNGKLDHAVNEVQPDGSTNMTAYVTICGKTYEAFGDKLGEVRPDKPSAPVDKPRKLPDMRRRTNLAGQVVRQHTLIGDFDVHYDELGYAVKASRV